jgi:hypothetical protein
MRRFAKFLNQFWWLPVALFVAALLGLVLKSNQGGLPVIPLVLLGLSIIWLLVWASFDVNSTRVSRSPELSLSPELPRHDIGSYEVELVRLRAELESRISEAVDFKAELQAKGSEIAALKSSLNRTETAELNEAIAQLCVGFEFERGRAEGEFAQVLAGLSESVDALFVAAALVKGAPAPGERFVDQPAGSCKVFKTELTSDATLKGTIKAVRSPWVGFMANGKLKVITASNVSVYA